MTPGLFLFAAAAPHWLVDPNQVRFSTLLLLVLAGLVLLTVILYWSGVVGMLLQGFGVITRGATNAGFRVWEATLSWLPWPVFLAIQLVLLAVGAAYAPSSPALAIAGGLAPLGMGLAACLAYMFIDVERYEVARGYKALHDPLKGQRLATELVRYGNRVEMPLLASATIGMIGGFALFNFSMFGLFGTAWYTAPGAEVVYLDFLISALVHLLSVVDLLNLANTHQLAQAVVARPVAVVAKGMLATFKLFFTLVLLQQIFASVRQGRLLAETITDFWSPHEPIHQRARAALLQYGSVALTPLLFSLRQAETLTREQREQLPHVIAMIGPTAIGTLIAHLGDPNEHVRAVAVTTLGRLRATAALPRLVGLASDESDLVRLSLAQALGEIADAPAVSEPRTTRRFRMRWIWRLVPARRRAAKVVVEPATVATPALRAALADTAAAVRAAAATSLGRLGHARAGHLAADLLALLGDPDETVRERAAEALGRIGADDPASVAALTSLLADPTPTIRAAATRALGALGKAAAAAVPDLVRLLQDADETVRTVAADAIGRMGTLDGEATGTLAQALTSEDNVVRAQTAEALGTIGAAAADVAPVLAVAATDENDMVRAKAVEALGKIGEAAADIAVPRLVRALRDPDGWVSALAAEALGEMGTAADEAVPALVRSLSHRNAQVRANAAEALGKLGSVAHPAVPALERAATDEEGMVRARAVRALGEIGTPTPATRAVVRAALSAPDPATRAAAAEAFGAWGHADEVIQGELLALLDDANDEVKVRVVRVLPRLVEGTPEVVARLGHRLSADDSDWVRAEAARALGQFGPAAAAAGEALLRAAQTGEAGLREEAMRALAISQPPEAAAAFTSGLRDAETTVRKLASAGWRKANAIPEEAVPVLIEALQDPEMQVRANAAHAIGRLDPVPGEAIPLLAECVLMADAGLRLHAALALQAVPGAAVVDALHPLLDDPNPRLRLIASRRILEADGADSTALKVVADALVDPVPGVRKAALDFVQTVPALVPSVFGLLQERADQESDPEISGRLIEAIRQLEQTAVLLPGADDEVLAISESPVDSIRARSASKVLYMPDLAGAAGSRDKKDINP
jgi:HEAT repeat protein